MDDLVNGRLADDYDPSEPEEPSEPATPAWAEDGALKILAIGNSFSIDTMSYAYDVAKSLGIKNVTLGNLVIGGCVIDTHYENIVNDKAKYKYYYNDNGTWSSTDNYDQKISTAIASDNWDFISVQQGSSESGLSSTYSNLAGLVTKVKQLAGEDTQIVFNMTWAYQSDSTHSSFPNYSNDQMTMYSGIVNAMRECVLTNADIDILVPNGTAIQNARTTYIGDKLTRDGYHLNYDYGRYIAALTFISKLTGISVENIAYKPSTVSEEQKIVCIESVMNALDAPLAISPSAYPTVPKLDEPEIEVPETDGTDIDLTKYELVELEIQIGVFYNSSLGHENLVTSSPIANQYFVTQKFTRETLPVGSIIVIDSDWYYRPDGWGSGTTRPAEEKENIVVVVTEEWWGNYQTRVFNVKRDDSAVITGYTEADLIGVLKIYVPKA